MFPIPISKVEVYIDCDGSWNLFKVADSALSDRPNDRLFDSFNVQEKWATPLISFWDHFSKNYIF